MPKVEDYKSTLKLMLILCVSFLLLFSYPMSEHSLGFYTPTTAKENTKQNFLLPEFETQTNQHALKTKQSRYASTLDKKWDFGKANELSEIAKINSDSAEVVIGVSNSHSNNIDNIANVIKTHKGKIVNTVMMENQIKAIVANIPTSSITAFTREIETTSNITYVEPNLKFKASFIPNDIHWSTQWGPQKIQADVAWDRQIGNKTVLVAVIDTGIDWNHPDLAANYVPLGYDWVNNDTDPMDDHGHGTHCAGIVAAVLNNSLGVAGLAQVRVMAEKGLDSDGYGYEDALAKAIIHAVDQGAKILSNSWGGYENSALIYDAVKYAYEKGVLIVAAAGNDAWNVKPYPAGYDEVIAVTATNASDAPAYFTNFGNWVELAAPGVNIYSTIYDNSYAYKSGTSMACPHVAGVAALVWSQFPNASRDWVRYWLYYTADDLGAVGFDEYYGYGRINAAKAVKELPEHEMLILNLETPRYVEPGHVGKINCTIFNLGRSGEANVTIQLLANGSIVDYAHLDFLASGVTRTVNFSWIPLNCGKYNITAYIMPVLGEEELSNNIKSAIIRVYYPEVALFQNTNPWGAASNEEIFDLHDVPYVVLESKNFETVNLSSFKKVVIASDQDNAFYEAMNRSRMWFENYVRDGGVLEIHAADQGWNGGTWLGALPGGLEWQSQGANYVTIVNNTHPILNTPNRITDSEIDNWLWSVHGHFSVYPENASTILAKNSGEPVLVEFKYGSGMIIASGQTLEWAYHYGYSLMLENSLLYPVYKFEHELAVFLEAPTSLIPYTSSLLNITLMNYGLSNETDLDLRILLNGNTTASLLIPELATNARFTFSHLWTPTNEEICNVTAYASPISKEEIKANNIVSEIVFVRYPKHILFDQTHGTDNANCYSFLIDKLSMRGFTIDLHVSGAITETAFEGYDVFVIPQADMPYLPSELFAIEKFVRTGGGLLVIGDNEPSIYTSLTGFAGITWSYYMTSGATRDIAQHIITAGVFSVSLPSPFVRMNVSDEAQSIVKMDGNIMLSTSIKSFGKVVGFADENALWDIGIEARDNLKLALNIIEWLSFPVLYEHEILVELEAPVYIKSNCSVMVNATAYNKGTSNETNVHLSIMINDSLAVSTIIPQLQVDSSYTLSYLWTPTDGIYNVTAYASVVEGEHDTENNVKSIITRVGYVDVAVTYASKDLDIAYIGLPIKVTITVRNFGNFTETFSVIVWANSTIVDVKTVTDLPSDGQTILIVEWNTAQMTKGNYSLKAMAESIQGDANMTNNTYFVGHVALTKVGDLGGENPPQFLQFDGKVDSKDLSLFLQCYKGVAPQEIMYLADLGGGTPPRFYNCDGTVNSKDLSLFLQCYKGLGPDS